MSLHRALKATVVNGNHIRGLNSHNAGRPGNPWISHGDRWCTTSCSDIFVGRRQHVAAARLFSSRRHITTTMTSNTGSVRKVDANKKSRIDKAVRKHEEMESVMGSGRAVGVGASSAAAEAGGSSKEQQQQQYFVEHYRKNRFRQALVNGCLSFFTVILAAQGVKNAHAKKKAEATVEKLQAELDDRRRELRSVLYDPEVLTKPLAREILLQVLKEREHSVVLSGGTSNWWSFRGRRAEQLREEATGDESLERSVEKTIRLKLQRGMLGRVAMTAEERDKSDLHRLAGNATAANDAETTESTSAAVSTLRSNRLNPQEDDDNVVDHQATATGTALKKKKQVYSF